MNLDFNLSVDKRFNARCSAIIYNKDKSKILLFKILDKDYYMLPGGRIEFYELSSQAIKREIKEETNYDLDFELISIQENFLEKDNTQIMQYNFCYKSIYEGNIIAEFTCLDNKNQIFKWINIKELPNYNIVPQSNLNLILNNPKEIKHLTSIN